MSIETIYFLIGTIFLITLNFILRKFNFLIEDENKSLHRKIFATEIKKVQSGGMFLLVSLAIFTFEQNIYLTISLILMFILGILSDIDFISSPKVRFFFQIFIIIFLIIFTSTYVEQTKIILLDYFIQNYIFSFFFTSFCLLILINGCNFIDGVNNLLIGYFLIISLCIFYITSENNEITFNETYINFAIISLIILLVFNFFSIIIMGDSGAYVLGLFFGFTLIHFSNDNLDISPIYILNLLWYPAFENLFSILRKLKMKISISKPDNFHLHHLIFKFIDKKFKNNSYINSVTGLLINIFNLFTLSIATIVSNHSLYLSLILIFNISSYILIYFYMLRKN
tara:strand:- start:10616 stop:11635 length:1020 start_codon:yes stop_codon:yes gene_type:complete